jgi:hypothetical protein
VSILATLRDCDVQGQWTDARKRFPRLKNASLSSERTKDAHRSAQLRFLPRRTLVLDISSIQGNEADAARHHEWPKEEAIPRYRVRQRNPHLCCKRRSIPGDGDGRSLASGVHGLQPCCLGHGPAPTRSTDGSVSTGPMRRRR